MFENPYIFGLDLYWVFIFIGIVSAVIFFRIASTKKDMSVKLYNFIIIDAALSIVIGYLASVLAEDIYEYINTGEYDPLAINYSAYITNLDISRMREAIKLLEGKHDFKGLAN